MVENPGCFEDFKLLYRATAGDKGKNFPYSATDNGALVVHLPDSIGIHLQMVAGKQIGNKEWVCLADGRLFLYYHDYNYRLYTLPREG